MLQKLYNKLIIDLYRQLIDLSSQALDMQSEIVRLTTEVKELRKEKEIEQQIVRYKELFVTLEDKPEIRYCSHYLDSEKKLIQIQCYDSGGFRCPHCTSTGVFDSELRKNNSFSHAFIGKIQNNHYWVIIRIEQKKLPDTH